MAMVGKCSEVNPDRDAQAIGLSQTGRKRDCAPAAARAERVKRSEDGTPDGVPQTNKRGPGASKGRGRKGRA